MSSLHCCGGNVDSATPKGNIQTIAGINCYLAPLQSGIIEDRLVVISPDVFGYKLPNVQLICDKFALELNCRCIVPDVFDGTEPPFDLMDSINDISNPQGTYMASSWAICRLLYYMPGFLIRNSKATHIERIEKVINEYKKSHNIQKVALQGYCWGGCIAIKIAQKDDLIDVAFATHPGGICPEDFKKLVKPTGFIFTSDTDMEIKKKQVNDFENILKEKTNSNNNSHDVSDTDSKAGNIVKPFTYILKDYPKMYHGFAVRGNEKDEIVLANRKDAFDTAVSFFKEHV